MAPYSGWINFDITDTFNKSSVEDKNTMNSNFQMIQNYKGLIFEGNISHQNSIPENQWILGDVRFIKDSQNGQIRYIVGDLNYQTKGFMTSSVGGGLSVSKEYSISPYMNAYSLEGSNIVLKRPSLVEVFVNGSQIESTRLPSGPVDLSNYPFMSGKNDVSIKITDDLGHVEFVNFSKLFNAQMLSKGLSEYSYNIEVPKETVGVDRKYKKNDPKFSAYYNFGVSNVLTSGFNVQGDEKTKLIGLEQIWLTAVGTFSLELAGSSRENYGAAERFQYRSLDRWSDKEAPFVFRTSFESRSRSFNQVGVQKTDLFKAIDGYISKRTGWNSSIGIGLSKRIYQISEDQLTARIDYSQPIGRSWSVGVNYSQDFHAEKEKKFFISITWSPQETNVQSYSSYNSTDKEYLTQLRHSRSNGSISSNVGAAISDSDVSSRQEVSGEVNTQYANTRLNYQNVDYKKMNQKSQMGQVNLRFATAWTNNSFDISRPINNSFAAVGSKSILSESVGVGQLSNYNAGSFSKMKNAIIVDPQPYAETNVAINTSDLPNNRIADKETFTIIPSYKSGMFVNIDIETRVFIVAKIVDEDNKDIVLQTGEVFSEKKKKVAEFFSNREGSIYIDQINKGTYYLNIDGFYPKKIIVKETNNDNVIYNIGTLKLKRKE